MLIKQFFNKDKALKFQNTETYHNAAQTLQKKILKLKLTHPSSKTKPRTYKIKKRNISISLKVNSRTNSKKLTYYYPKG
jgi:hypothetical protein